MEIVEILLFSLGLSMDAFAVAVCKGLSVTRLQKKHYLIIGAWFGGFQALMPLFGYFLGASFEKYITAVDHWVAFILLFLIGGNMLREAFAKKQEELNSSFGFKTMLFMAVATSIDALAIGITFALADMKTHIALIVLIIGSVAFALSALGLKIGNAFGAKYKSKAECAGGIILILLGLKILLEGLGILNF